MKRHTTIQVFVSTVSLLYFALGCTRVNSPENTSSTTSEINTWTTPTPTYIVPVTSEPDPLYGTRWKLVAFESEKITPDIPERPQFFVRFHNGQLNFQGGCNSIGGHYVLQNDHITITFAERTEVDCSRLGSNVNDIEMLFSDAMLTFDTYVLDKDELRIHYIDGEILLHRVSE